MPKAVESVRLIAVQFSFSNPKAVPSTLRRLNAETATESAKRRLKNERSDGYVILKPTENCSLSKLPDGLLMAGYKLANAFYQERLKSGRSYHMMRFLFSREERTLSGPTHFKKIRRERNEIDFRDICNSALWRAQAFSNLFYGDSEMPTGERVVNIALAARQPLFRPDGTPVTVWQKGEDGERIGDSPRALSAEYHLRLKEVVADMTLPDAEDADWLESKE